MKLSTDSLIANRYQLARKLGQGGFADVWLAFDTKLDNLEIALKIFVAEKGLDESGLNLFKKEFLNTRELQHPNLLVPSHFEIIEEGSIPMLVMTFCKGGSLAGKVDEGVQFVEEEIIKIIKQTSSGLAELHSKEILHRDIKPGNILQDAKGNYLLSDFGISSRLTATLTKATTRQSYLTPAYSSPERYSKNPEDTAAGDIFSLGVTIYELCTGNLPWSGQGGVMLLKGAEVPSLPEKYSRVLNDMIERCMATVPAQRPTARELTGWVDNYSFNPSEVKAKERTEPKPISNTGKETVILHPEKEQPVKIKPAAETPIQKEAIDINPTYQQATVKVKSNKSLWVSLVITTVVIIGGLLLWNSIEVTEWNLNEETPAADTIQIMPDTTSYYSDTTVAPIDESLINSSSPSHQVPAQQTSGIQANNATSTISEDDRLNGIFNEGVTAYTAENYERAFPLIREAAENGVTNAYVYLGDMYFNGRGTSVYYIEGLKWLRLAANGGSDYAQYALGLAYSDGNGVTKDKYEAVKWFRLSADQGNSGAQFMLGTAYYDGDGITKDYYEAAKWYRLAADQGSESAQVFLGDLYYEGQGVGRDYYEAVKWYRKAANQGNKFSQARLAKAYHVGVGVNRDDYEAVKWYRKAADQGYVDAMYWLGLMHEEGEGVQQDVDKALLWYKQAADLDHEAASEAVARFSLKVTGRVTAADDGSSMPGVNVILKGTTNGTVTDADGRYSIKIGSDSDVLVFSFVGLRTEEVRVGTNRKINVTMRSRR